jgi:uncharacterized protein (TIGR00251 family)
VIEIRNIEAGASFRVRVQPRAKRNAVAGEIAGALKIAVTAPPIEGAANAACMEFVAKLLKAPRGSISIAAGATSRNKVLVVAGMTPAELRSRLCAAGIEA